MLLWMLPVEAFFGKTKVRSLYAHNGELETASDLVRRLIDSFDLENRDAIITNAAACSSHLKAYGCLLEGDAAYSKKAAQWSAKLKGIHEFLSEIGIRRHQRKATPHRVTYHKASSPLPRAEHHQATALGLKIDSRTRTRGA